VYLYLGADVAVPAGEVVTILDVRLLQSSEANRQLVEQAIASGRLQAGALEGCRALVVTSRGLYPSAVSPQSLARRLGALSSYP